MDTTTRAARTSTASTEAKVASPAHDRRERVGAGPAVAGVGDRKRGRRLKLSGQRRAAVLEKMLLGRQTAARMAKLHKVNEAADRAEGRRILAALPRLARGEGWVWAPGDGVLEQAALPRIRTLDSSATPRREGQVSTPGTLAAVDWGNSGLAAIAAALAGTGMHAGGHGNPSLSGHRHAAAQAAGPRACGGAGAGGQAGG